MGILTNFDVLLTICSSILKLAVLNYRQMKIIENRGENKIPMKQKTMFFVAAMLIASVVLAACGGGAAPTQAPAQSGDTSTSLPAGSVQINGAGATFPLPVYTEWIYAYQYVDPSVTLNYQGIGSGGGKKAIIDNTVDFAGSDSLLKDDEYQKGGDLQMYPMLAGAVVPIYNIEGLTEEDPVLVLDRETLANIYLGKISKWNDPAIQDVNCKPESRPGEQTTRRSHHRRASLRWLWNDRNFHQRSGSF